MRFEILCKIDWLSIRSEAFVDGIIIKRESVPDIITELDVLVKEIEDLLGYNPTLTQLYYEMASYFFEAKNLDFYEQRLKEIQGRTTGDDMKNLPELGEAIRRIRKAHSQGVITPNEKKAIEKNTRMLVGLWIEIIESIGADIESIKSGLKRPQQSRKKHEPEDKDVSLTDDEIKICKGFTDFFKFEDGKYVCITNQWESVCFLFGLLHQENFVNEEQRIKKYLNAKWKTTRRETNSEMGSIRVSNKQDKLQRRFIQIIKK